MLRVIRKHAWEQIEQLRYLMNLTEQISQRLQEPNYDVDSDPSARQFMEKALHYPPSELPSQPKAVYRKIQELSQTPVARGGFRPSGRYQQKIRQLDKKQRRKRRIV